MSTLQSLRALSNGLLLSNGRFPNYFPQQYRQTPIEKYAVAMRYASGIVQYYKDNYSYPEVQYGQSMNLKESGYFEDNSIGK